MTDFQALGDLLFSRENIQILRLISFWGDFSPPGSGSETQSWIAFMHYCTLFLAGFASPVLEFGFDVKIDHSEGMRQECGIFFRIMIVT
jgi:hypothetical protein